MIWRTHFVLLCLLSFTALGCPKWHRGDFTMVAREAIVTETNGRPTTGKACFNMAKNYTLQDDAVFEFAVRDAILNADGGNALLNATFEDKGLCVHVTGTAVTK